VQLRSSVRSIHKPLGAAQQGMPLHGHVHRHSHAARRRRPACGTCARTEGCW
jgi:hypothetical protein